MAAALGAAIMPRRKAARIGRVERHGKMALGQKLPRRFDDLWGAGGPVTIAQNKIGGLRPARQAGRRWHRVAVDQQTAAEHLLGILDKPAQCLMVRVVQGIHALFGLGEAQLTGIDLLTARDNAGDRAEPHAHPRRTRIHKTRQHIGEHRWVEFPRLAVDVEIGPGEARREQRGAELGPGAEQHVDKTVFGAAQRQRIEPRGGQEVARIFRSAMRRGENEGQRARRRLAHVEGASCRRQARNRTVHAASLVRRCEAVIIDSVRASWRLPFSGAAVVLPLAEVAKGASPRSVEEWRGSFWPKMTISCALSSVVDCGGPAMRSMRSPMARRRWCKRTTRIMTCWWPTSCCLELTACSWRAAFRGAN